MVTLSELGIYISDNGSYHNIPAEIRDIADVSGAGDTVISTASLCLAAGLSPWDIACISNLAGGIVCEKLGVVPIDKDLLIKANMYERQKVDIVNVNNGERFSTYIIAGEKGEICINGAAARKAAKDDVIIIIAYASIPVQEAEDFLPSVVFVDKDNNIVSNPTIEDETRCKAKKFKPSKLPIKK